MRVLLGFVHASGSCGAALIAAVRCFAYLVYQSCSGKRQHSLGKGHDTQQVNVSSTPRTKTLPSSS